MSLNSGWYNILLRPETATFSVANRIKAETNASNKTSCRTSFAAIIGSISFILSTTSSIGVPTNWSFNKSVQFWISCMDTSVPNWNTLFSVCPWSVTMIATALWLLIGINCTCCKVWCLLSGPRTTLVKFVMCDKISQLFWTTSSNE